MSNFDFSFQAGYTDRIDYSRMQTHKALAFQAQKTALVLFFSFFFVVTVSPANKFSVTQKEKKGNCRRSLHFRPSNIILPNREF